MVPLATCDTQPLRRIICAASNRKSKFTQVDPTLLPILKQHVIKHKENKVYLNLVPINIKIYLGGPRAGLSFWRSSSSLVFVRRRESSEDGSDAGEGPS